MSKLEELTNEVSVMQKNSSGITEQGGRMSLDKLIQQYCPDGVEWKTLGEVCDIHKGVQFNKTDMKEIGTYPVKKTGTFMMSGINFPSDAAAMPGEFITDARFLFPPQTFSLDSGAAIIINVTDNGRIISGKIPLAGVSWDTGKLYTYAISYSGGRVSASMTESFRDWGSYDMDDRDIHM